MSIREKLKGRDRGELVDIPDFGQVRIARASVSSIVAMTKQKDERGSVELVRLTVRDEEGRPLFASEEEVRAIDWPLFTELLKASQRVNALDRKVEDAEKN